MIFIIIVCLAFIGGLVVCWQSLTKAYTAFQCTMQWGTLFVPVCVAILVILVFIWAIYASANVFTSNRAIYNQIYDIEENIEASGGMVSKIVNMFRMPANALDSDEPKITITSNNPLLVYQYAKTHPKKIVKLNPVLDVNDTLNPDCSTKDIKTISGQDFVSKCIPATHDGCMYPFVPGSPINPVILKRQVLRLDTYGQLALVNKSINWFKGFLLKKYDPVYSNSSVPKVNKEPVIQKTIEILTKRFVLVNDLAINDSVATVTTVSEEDGFISAVPNENIVAMAFDKRTGTFKTVQHGVSGGLTFQTSDKSKEVLIQLTSKSNNVLLVDGYKMDTNLLSKSFEQKNKSDVHADMPRNVGMLIPESSSFMSPYISKDETMIYSDVYSMKGSDIGPTTFVSNAKDVLSANANRLDAIYSKYKKCIVAAIVQAVESVDSTNTFVFDQRDIDRIINVVQQINRIASTLVTDMLVDASAKLHANYATKASSLSNNADSISKYIPYSRFVDKLKSTSSKQFVTQFMYHADMAMACSRGLRDLHDKYDYSKYLHKNQVKLADFSMVMFLVIGLIGEGMYCFNDFYIEKKPTMEPEPSTNTNKQVNVTPESNPQATVEKNTDPVKPESKPQGNLDSNSDDSKITPQLQSPYNATIGIVTQGAQAIGKTDPSAPPNTTLQLGGDGELPTSQVESQPQSSAESTQHLNSTSASAEDDETGAEAEDDVEAKVDEAAENGTNAKGFGLLTNKLKGMASSWGD